MSIATYLSIVILCGIFVVSEFLSKKTKYVIPAYLFAMLTVIIFGGQFGLITMDLFTDTGFYEMVYSFGLPFVLISFGASISFDKLKGEWKTVVIAVASVVLILVVGFASTIFIDDLRVAMYGSLVVAGGGPAGLVLLTKAQELGDDYLVQLILILMSIQLLLGYPVCSVSMRKGMKIRMSAGTLPSATPKEDAKNEAKKKVFTIPDTMQTFYFIFFMMGLCALISYKIYEITTISQHAWYILLGFAFSELGLLDKQCLTKSGGSGLLYGAMYAVIVSGFVTMNLLDLVSIIPVVILMLALGVVGCVIATLLLTKGLKLNIYETFAIAMGCMVGYPPSAKITGECVDYLNAQAPLDDETKADLLAYYEPKIIISGIVSISILTGFIAGFMISFI